MVDWISFDWFLYWLIDFLFFISHHNHHRFIILWQSIYIYKNPCVLVDAHWFDFHIDWLIIFYHYHRFITFIFIVIDIYKNIWMSCLCILSNWSRSLCTILLGFRRHRSAWWWCARHENRWLSSLPQQLLIISGVHLSWRLHLPVVGHCGLRFVRWLLFVLINFVGVASRLTFF